VLRVDHDLERRIEALRTGLQVEHVGPAVRIPPRELVAMTLEPEHPGTPADGELAARTVRVDMDDAAVAEAERIRVVGECHRGDMARLDERLDHLRARVQAHRAAIADDRGEGAVRGDGDPRRRDQEAGEGLGRALRRRGDGEEHEGEHRHGAESSVRGRRRA
jgi:hypothetical protein